MKVIFSDIDGTFMENHQTPEINIQAVKLLEEAGHRFVFVSGRGAVDVEKLLEDTGLECDYIYGNGAGYKLNGEEPVLKHFVPRAHYDFWEKTLQRPDVFYYIHTDKGLLMQPFEQIDHHFETLRKTYAKIYDEETANGVANRKEYFKQMATFTENPFTFLRENPNYHLIKFEVMNGEEEIRERLKQQSLDFGYRAFNSMFVNLEIVPQDSNKGDGIKDYLSLFDGVTQTLGFGDAENDIELFEAVDLPIAASGAKKEIHQYCDVFLDTPIGEYMIEEILK